MIAAQRIKPLNQSFSTAVADFSKVTHNDLLSAGLNVNLSLTDALSKLALTPNGDISKAQADTGLADSNLLASVQNPANTPIAVNNTIARQIPGMATLQAGINTLGGLNKENIFTNIRSAKTYIVANGGLDRTLVKAANAEINDYLSSLTKLTGGVYNPSLSAKNASIQILTTMSKQAMLYGLPPVYETLSNIPAFRNAVVAAIAGVKVYKIAIELNDLASALNVLESPAGPNVVASNPMSIDQLLKSVALTTEKSDADKLALFTRVNSAITNINPGWLFDGTTTTLTPAKEASGVYYDILKLSVCQTNNQNIVTHDVNVPSVLSSNELLSACGNILGGESVLMGINQISPKYLNLN